MSQAVASIRALGSKPCIHFSFLPFVLYVRTILTPRFIRHNDTCERFQIMMHRYV